MVDELLNPLMMSVRVGIASGHGPVNTVVMLALLTTPSMAGTV